MEIHYLCEIVKGTLQGPSIPAAMSLCPHDTGGNLFLLGLFRVSWLKPTISQMSEAIPRPSMGDMENRDILSSTWENSV